MSDPRFRRSASPLVLFLSAFLLMPAVPSGLLGLQAPRDSLLVSPDWLAGRLEEDDLVLLHVGPEEEYAEEHIPGARYVTHRTFAAPEGEGTGATLNLQLPDPESLAETLEGLGISDNSRIVVYYGADWVTPATRVVFTLDWIGLGRRTSFLDGGMQRWKAEGHPITDVLPEPATAGEVTPRPREELLARADFIRDRLDAGDFQIIDARAPDHFNGVRPTYLMGEPVRKGHIRGATNVFAMELVGEDLRLKPEEELAAIFAEAGVEPGDTVITYCHLGQFATLVLFGARTLGYRVMLYDESFQEWGSLGEAYPVSGGGQEP